MSEQAKLTTARVLMNGLAQGAHNRPRALRRTGEGRAARTPDRRDITRAGILANAVEPAAGRHDVAGLLRQVMGDLDVLTGEPVAAVQHQNRRHSLVWR